VGHATDREAITGCTAILCDGGAVGGVDVRGSASGTRELDALSPLHLVERCHAVILAGGSAFGLDAAAGVMEFLEARGVGFDVGVTRVPIVPAAILFDLRIGRHDVRPDRTMGARAAEAADAGPVAQGSVGAGTGATVGKLRGMAHAMKGGLGTAAAALLGGVVVGALAAVNAFGDVVDPETGCILAGLRGPDGRPAGTGAAMRAGILRPGYAAESTTLAVVATNARLTKSQATKLAAMAQNGIARVVSPPHTTFDGDLVFALATGQVEADLNLLGAAAADLVVQAILRGIKKAETLGGVPAFADL
jgi:L-aminopeptidase/D-esterase-like protein